MRTPRQGVPSFENLLPSPIPPPAHTPSKDPDRGPAAPVASLQNLVLPLSDCAGDPRRSAPHSCGESLMLLREDY